MPLAVFLRGVNVGGHKAFQPSALARRLDKLRVRSLGAAGTFVVLTRTGVRTARSEFLKQLPFDAGIMICTADELGDLVRQDPFREHALDDDLRGFVTVLDRRPQGIPRLPIYQPEGRSWQVAVVAVHGRFVVSLLRRTGRNLVYPNEVVEKRFGVGATTRSWNTIVKLHQALASG